MNERILRQRAFVALAESDLNRTIAEVQTACPHTRCAEAVYKECTFLANLPPMGICLDCGMTEEGWSTYFGLKGLYHVYNSMPRIDRDELYKLRVGLHLDDEKKTRLCRKEASLAVLIAEWLEKRTA